MTSPEQLAGPDRSRRLFGAEVIDVDGAKVGTVSQVFLDDDTDQPRWVSIRTGRFGTSESLVPLQGAEINGDRIRVQYDKATISGAPRSDGGQPLSRDDEGELYRHYHRDSPARHAPAGDAAVDGRTSDERGVDRPGVDRPGVDSPGVDSPGVGGPGLAEWAAKGDGSMVRSEQQLAVGTERVAAGRARVRKFLVTEKQQITVSVSREDVRIEYVTDADLGSNDVHSQGFSAVGAPTTGFPAAASSTTGVPPTDSPVADSPVAASSTTGASRGRQIDRPLRDHDLAGDGGHTAANGDEWVVLYAQRPVVTMEWVPVERVRIGTIEVAGQETVSGEVRKERVEVLGDVPDVGLEAAGGPSGSR